MTTIVAVLVITVVLWARFGALFDRRFSRDDSGPDGARRADVPPDGDGL